MGKRAARRCVQGALEHSAGAEDESRGTVGKVRCVMWRCSGSERMGVGDFDRNRILGGRKRGRLDMVDGEGGSRWR